MNTMTDRDTHRVIPLMDVRPRSLAVPAAAFDAGTRASADGLLTDTRGRPLRDLRISVTDRCNFAATIACRKKFLAPTTLISNTQNC
jgi:cyclic pyranopterin phosphate synthase